MPARRPATRAGCRGRCCRLRSEGRVAEVAWVAGSARSASQPARPSRPSHCLLNLLLDLFPLDPSPLPSLAEKLEEPREDLDAVPQLLKVELLVRGMQPVVGESDAGEQYRCAALAQ